jgi:trk system potassium uptake protein TrkH
MRFLSIQRLLGLMLMVFSALLLPPVLVSWLYNDGELRVFLVGAAVVFSLGLLGWLPARRFREELRVREGFLIVVMFWVMLGLVGALPLALAVSNPCPD